MSEDTKYNGWTNYATWRINLELCDDITSNLVGERTFDSVRDLAIYLEESVYEILEQDGTTGIALGYARAFVSDVNWFEIAESNADELVRRETALFTCRDIGYGIETGEVYLPAREVADPSGAGPSNYETVQGDSVWLFADELVESDES